MIPRKIHFCWFSEEPYPETVKTCIDSWKRFLPQYELVLWDSKRAKAAHIPWIDKALEEKRWAFAADAVRLYAIYTEGGIYLDSDVEVLKNFDPLLERDYFFGYENGSDRIEAAVFGAKAGFPAIRDALHFYQSHPFDYNEHQVDFLVIPHILRESFRNWNLEIFDESVFSPKSFTDGSIRTTDSTFCIHHFSSSWRPKLLQKSILRRQWIYRHFPRPASSLLAYALSLWTNLRNLGFRGTCQKFFKKF